MGMIQPKSYKLIVWGGIAVLLSCLLSLLDLQIVSEACGGVMNIIVRSTLTAMLTVGGLFTMLLGMPDETGTDVQHGNNQLNA